MTQYVIGYVNALKNADKMSEYKTVAAKALAKHGGAVVVPATKPEQLEGQPETARPVLILSFPTSDAARAWRNDPTLADVHELRRVGADMSFLLVENIA
ncbi:MAG TPA: DUF1330 domain-containing protein [Octadecabacter sp.]|nr:DUF1330 domain-containing protein [Octadecabacter sp.]